MKFVDVISFTFSHSTLEVVYAVGGWFGSGYVFAFVKYINSVYLNGH